MAVKDGKALFRLVDCRKSQVKTVNAWYWTFYSNIIDGVHIQVTTYGDGILPLYIDEEKNESEAWIKLEKALGLS